jgi:hypothetical protein
MLDSILRSTNERDEHGTAYAPLVVLRVGRVSVTTRWFVQVQLGRAPAGKVALGGKAASGRKAG